MTLKGLAGTMNPVYLGGESLINCATWMIFRLSVPARLLLLVLASPPVAPAQTNPPIYISFLWHMHQPIYWPGESVLETESRGHYSYSVVDIHNQRTGPYTVWPAGAVQRGIAAGFPHFGAQVSFSGSLIENLNTLEAGGNPRFQRWKAPWDSIKARSTLRGNPRLDMVAFGYHHPLMALIDSADLRRQIRAHRQAMTANFTGAPSRGMFPPENAFSPRMIPSLAAEGIRWVMVDNIHFDRASEGYPFSTGGNIYEPNRADVLNPNPNDWVQLTGLWAPTRNSARWGRQPHDVEYVDPSTGGRSRIVAVPTDRYLGNEDGRGGFGALNYEGVMSQLEPYNTDPAHPILIVLHHDGDNYGGGTEAYYNYNFQNFVNWLLANPTRFVCTTVEDYLGMFPPDTNDVIHAEDGSWSGADNGDPKFKKWNGDPSGGYSPDRNSWGVITAAKNYVLAAERADPGNPNTALAWKYQLNGEASDYWYWDGAQNGVWDAHPTRAANEAVQYARQVISSRPDNTPPTIYLPQREPYNPGGTEWNIRQPSDFMVWTYAFDTAGLRSVTLRYRLDLDGVNPRASVQNETYAGGGEVGVWTGVPMTGRAITPRTDPQPLAKAQEYSAPVAGLANALVDYYVEAVDSAGNIGRSPIQHVWVGPRYGGSTGYVMDGTLDSAARPVATAGGLTLYAAWNGTDLYVATGAAQAQGADMFIFLSDSTRTPRAAPWAKAGRVAGWSAFLGNESTNGWSGWFDQNGPAGNSAGGVLEGTLDLAGEFGRVPARVNLAVGKYQTADGGSLAAQVPAGNGDGNIDSLELFELVLPAVSVAELSEIPDDVVLLQNYPNPFNGATVIRFSLQIAKGDKAKGSARVRLGVYDVLGREVAVLINGNLGEGAHSAVWNAAGMPSGIYFYRLEGNGYVKTGKMTLMK